MSISSIVAAIAGVLMLAPVATDGWAQTSTGAGPAYPSKPIRLILPSPPGGGTDTMARIMARALSEGLGGQVVVDNRGGASGRIGTEVAAKSPPDGYALLFGGVTPLATIPAAAPKLGYDTLRDFAPISMVAVTDYIVVAHPSLPVKSIRELIVLAKSRPGQINYASVGILSGAHVAGELLKQLAKIDVVHVPYNGGGPAVTATLTGEVSFYFGSGVTVSSHISAGRLRALASTGTRRSKAYATLPTLAETVPGFEATQWYGILAPAGTPADVLARLHAVIVKAVATPAVAQQITATGADPVTNTPQEFAGYMKSEIAKWTKVIKTPGIVLE